MSISSMSLPKVRCRDLQPQQRSARIGMKRSTDCYERVMLKHPYRSTFYSRAELYFAALQEADSSVNHYVPQPFSLRIGSSPYIPDFYRLINGSQEVIELTSNGQFDPVKTKVLATFFEQYDMRFQVVSNDWSMDQSILAENWLMITGQLVTTQSIETHKEEQILLEHFSGEDDILLSDIINPGDRIGSLTTETALFRLLHRGCIQADLVNSPLDYDTRWRIAS